jgi:hypothetical protein
VFDLVRIAEPNWNEAMVSNQMVSSEIPACQLRR